MKIKTNFCDASLIYNEPVKFLCYDDTTNKLAATFTMRLPTYRDFSFNHSLQLIAGLLNQDIATIARAIPNVKNLSSHYNFFSFALAFNNPEIQYYAANWITVLELLDVPIKVETEPGPHYSIAGTRMDEPLFDEITKILLISLDLKKRSEYEMSPEQKALEDKINRIKKQGKQQGGSGKTLSTLDIYTLLSYHLGYTQDQIMGMTLYMINYLVGVVGAAEQYELHKLALATGNSKDKKLKSILEYLRRKK